MRLTFKNAIKFNPPHNAVHINAVKLLEMFENSLRATCVAYSGESVETASQEEIDALLNTYPLGATKFKPKAQGENLHGG